MKTRIVVVCLVALSAACGSGGATGGCESYAEAFCSKTFRCSAAEAQARYTTEAGCRSAVASELGCSTLSANPCASGQRLDSSGLEQCVSDTKDQDCVSFSRSAPASCSGDLFVCR
jgi:hypothetical protein